MIAERDQVRCSIMDLFKVLTFLIVTLVARYALTKEHVSHIDGVSLPVFSAEAAADNSPDLMDLSTVGF